MLITLLKVSTGVFCRLSRALARWTWLPQLLQVRRPHHIKVTAGKTTSPHKGDSTFESESGRSEVGKLIGKLSVNHADPYNEEDNVSFIASTFLVELHQLNMRRFVFGLGDCCIFILYDCCIFSLYDCCIFSLYDCCISILDDSVSLFWIMLLPYWILTLGAHGAPYSPVYCQLITIINIGWRSPGSKRAPSLDILVEEGVKEMEERRKATN